VNFLQIGLPGGYFFLRQTTTKLPLRLTAFQPATAVTRTNKTAIVL
jgi:hypothetical protein